MGSTSSSIDNKKKKEDKPSQALFKPPYLPNLKDSVIIETQLSNLEEQFTKTVPKPGL